MAALVGPVASEFADAVDLAAAVVADLSRFPRVGEVLENPQYDHFGIDIHAGPSGDVFYLAVFH